MVDELRPVNDSLGIGPPVLSKNIWIFSHAVRAAAAIAGVSAIGFSLYFFLGFAENDQGILHLLQAFFLCFGLGAALYFPAFYICRSAHKYLKYAARPGLRVYILMLPWIILGLFLLRNGGRAALYGAVLILLGAIFIFWALRCRRRTR